MSVRERVWTLFRLFALFTVMVAVALTSAITTIRLTIHGHQAITPNLVGVPFDTAQRIASGLGLDLKVEDKMFSDQFPANQIVSQIPARGASMKMGQHIHVLVSLGLTRVTVPQLVGVTLRAAQITAVQRGLTVGDVAAVHWSGSEVDQIMAQDPPPATAAVHSPAVNILVSLGEPPRAFICPSFVGRSLSEARRAVERSGFRVGQVIPVPTTAVPLDTVLSQTPAPGSKIGAGGALVFQAAAPPENIPPAIPPEGIPPAAAPPAATPPTIPQG